MSQVVSVSRIIDAPADELYRAFIEPELHVAWGPTRFDNDPVVGGTYHQEVDMDESTQVVSGEYLRLVPDRLIEMTFEHRVKGSNEVTPFVVTVRIEPGAGDGTRIVVTETGDSIVDTTPGDAYHEAWSQVLDMLESFLTTRELDGHTMTREFASNPERLFAAWTTPVDLEVWLADRAEVEPHAGGSFVLTSLVNEEEHVCSGEYIGFVPGERIVKTWRYTGPETPVASGTTEMTIVFRSVRDEITEMRFTESGAGLGTARERRESSDAWDGAFDTLKELMES